MNHHEPGSIVVGVDVGGLKKGFHAVAFQDGKCRLGKACFAHRHLPGGQDATDRRTVQSHGVTTSGQTANPEAE